MDDPLPPVWQEWDERRPKKERGSWAWHDDQLVIAGHYLEYPPPPVPVQSVSLWLRNLSPKDQQAIDGAVQHYAASNRWPPLDAAQKYALKLRIDLAREIVAERRQARQRAPEETRSEIFRWLLIDCWQAQHGGSAADPA